MQFYIQITFGIFIEVYFLTGYIKIIGIQKQLHISFGTAVVYEKIFMVRNSPIYKQISSILYFFYILLNKSQPNVLRK